MADSDPKRATVLVVDDSPANIDVMAGVLRPFYKVKAALAGDRALMVAESSPRPDMILLDIMMPEMDGYEVCRRLKRNPVTADIPVIFVTAMADEHDEEQGLAVGAVDYIIKPISPPIVLARIRTHLALHRQNLELEWKVRQRTEELGRTRLEIIRRLGRASEFRDNETGLHILRMSHYSHLIAQSLDVSESWAELVFHAAPMHDVGKIGIPDMILLKPTALNEAEWALMKQHPLIGADIIGEDPSDIMMLSREIALGHHERWDGSGYPSGSRGGDIPLSARIVAIADVFDALTTERPYKKAWSVEEALTHMQQQVGRHFDPDLLSIFHAVLPQVLMIKEKYAEQATPFAVAG